MSRFREVTSGVRKSIARAAGMVCGLVIFGVGCSEPINSQASLQVVDESEGLELTTIQESRGIFPHRMMYLLLQK